MVKKIEVEKLKFAIDVEPVSLQCLDLLLNTLHIAFGALLRGKFEYVANLDTDLLIRNLRTSKLAFGNPLLDLGHELAIERGLNMVFSIGFSTALLGHSKAQFGILDSFCI